MTFKMKMKIYFISAFVNQNTTRELNLGTLRQCFQDVILAAVSAALGNWLEIHILGPHRGVRL